jgi:hypothetical protein
MSSVLSWLASRWAGLEQIPFANSTALYLKVAVGYKQRERRGAHNRFRNCATSLYAFFLYERKSISIDDFRLVHCVSRSVAANYVFLVYGASDSGAGAGSGSVSK